MWLDIVLFTILIQTLNYIKHEDSNPSAKREPLIRGQRKGKFHRVENTALNLT